MAGGLSAEEFETWLPPRLAMALLRDLGADYTIASAINERVCNGHLGAAAAETITPNRRVEFWTIDAAVWKAGPPGWQDQFWDRSDVQITVDPHGHRRTDYQFVGVRFEPSGLKRIKRDAGLVDPLPSLGGEPPVEIITQQLSRGGRPPKPYWEDAIVEMFDRIYHEGFNPVTQAEVEAAMLTWIYQKHGDTPSEASVRTRAAKVFKVHKKEG